MDEILTWQLEDIPREQLSLVLAGMAFTGCLYCFLGYRLIKFVLGLTGFLLAGSTAAVIVGFLSYGHVVAMGIALALGGLCGAMALFFLYRTGVFCLGMIGAGVAAFTILQGREESWILWAVAGSGLAGGLLALLVERPVVKLATAAIGAMLLTQAGLGVARDQGLLEALSSSGSGGAVATPENLPYLGWAVLGVWVLFTLLGSVAQFGGGGKK